MPAKTTGPGIEVQGPKSIAEAADDDADADTNDWCADKATDPPKKKLNPGKKELIFFRDRAPFIHKSSKLMYDSPWNFWKKRQLSWEIPAFKKECSVKLHDNQC